MKSTINIPSIAFLEAERKRDRATEGKFELIFGKEIEMSGASRIHNKITSNLHILIGNLISDSDFEIFQADLRVANLLNNSYVYPDLVVSNVNAEFLDDKFDTLLNPILVIEVLSESTEKIDRSEKFKIYREMESLKEYILVSQKEPLIEVFSKNPQNKWEFEFENNLEGSIKLQSLNLTIPLKEVYKKVAF